MDEEVLGAAYRALGTNEPWHYRSPRDARTLLQVLQETGVANRLMEVELDGVLHHALDDARNEARFISAAYQDLTTPDRVVVVPLLDADEDDGA